MKNFAQGYEQMRSASAQNIVRSSGACGCSPDRRREIIEGLADGAVDELMLFMQSYPRRTTRSRAGSSCLSRWGHRRTRCDMVRGRSYHRGDDYH